MVSSPEPQPSSPQESGGVAVLNVTPKALHNLKPSALRGTFCILPFRKGDLLSQRRGYCRKKGGFSLGFDDQPFQGGHFPFNNLAIET